MCVCVFGRLCVGGGGGIHVIGRCVHVPPPLIKNGKKALSWTRRGRDGDCVTFVFPSIFCLMSTLELHCGKRDASSSHKCAIIQSQGDCSDGFRLARSQAQDPVFLKHYVQSSSERNPPKRWLLKLFLWNKQYQERKWRGIRTLCMLMRITFNKSLIWLDRLVRLHLQGLRLFEDLHFKEGKVLHLIYIVLFSLLRKSIAIPCVINGLQFCAGPTVVFIGRCFLLSTFLFIIVTVNYRIQTAVFCTDDVLKRW